MSREIKKHREEGYFGLPEAEKKKIVEEATKEAIELQRSKMKTFDEKLREILEKVFRAGIAFEREDAETGSHLFLSPDQAIPAIKQAIAEKMPDDCPRKPAHPYYDGYNALGTGQQPDAKLLPPIGDDSDVK